jgi:hypothetical protein
MKRLKLFTLTSLCLICAMAAPVQAQDKPARPDTMSTDPLGAAPSGERPYINRLGIFGTLNLFLHRSDFNTLPGVPSCCPHYLSGSGTGYTVGMIYDHKLEEGWMVGARLGYEHVEGRFVDREPTTLIIDGVARDGAFEHRLNADYGILTLQPLIGYRVLDNVAGRFSLIANAGIGFAMKTRTHFRQYEEIVEPEGLTFYVDTLDGGSTTRNDRSGEIPEAITFMMDLRIGIGLETQLNRSNTLSITPELWYSLGMSPVVHTVNWSVDGLRAGLAIRYALPYSRTADTLGAPAAVGGPGTVGTSGAVGASGTKGK